MNTNDTKVDVLAVLREFATKRDPFGGDVDEGMRQYCEARAAVAELIEAASDFQLETRNGTATCPQRYADRLEAALERIGGAA